MNVQRGQRGKLEEHFDLSSPIRVKLHVNGSAVYDYCCFGVDENGKLSDERYMVFYNQTSSPQKEIIYQIFNHNAVFTLHLNRLPNTIHKLIFTVSIDGKGTMGQISDFQTKIAQEEHPPIILELLGTDFSLEKAIISFEIYRKDVWRYSAVARGFNGGLGDLLRSFGGVEDNGPSNPTISSPAPVHPVVTTPPTINQGIPSQETATSQPQTVNQPQMSVMPSEPGQNSATVEQDNSKQVLYGNLANQLQSIATQSTQPQQSTGLLYATSHQAPYIQPVNQPQANSVHMVIHQNTSPVIAPPPIVAPQNNRELRACACPRCGANLTIKDTNREFAFCEFCGAKIMLDDYRISQRIIDEAQLKRVEVEQENMKFNALQSQRREILARWDAEEAQDQAGVAKAKQALTTCLWLCLLGIGIYAILFVALYYDSKKKDYETKKKRRDYMRTLPIDKFFEEMEVEWQKQKAEEQKPKSFLQL